MPRRYRMITRMKAVSDTRARIVKSAKDLHARHGLQGTSYEEIAQHAGVAQATVYRHFPTLADLIPACAQSIQVLQPLTTEEVDKLIQGWSQPWQRLEWIMIGTFQCYERDGGWLQAARREGDLIPALSKVIKVQQESLKILVRAALQETGISEHSVRVLAALIDFPLWKTLRDMGLSADDATEQVLQLVRDQLAKEKLI